MATWCCAWLAHDVSRGLHGHDVHGRHLMVEGGPGQELVVSLPEQFASSMSMARCSVSGASHPSAWPSTSLHGDN